MKTILETPRLMLRELTQMDLPALCRMLQNPEVMYAYEHAFDDAEAQEWLDRQLSRYDEYGLGLWAVILKESGELIGQCGLTMQDCGGEQVIEVGYLFVRDFWHNGYATEAARACRDYAFDKLGAERVYSIIRDNNMPSQKVAQRNGMKPGKTFVKHYYNMDMPHIAYSISRREYSHMEKRITAPIDKETARSLRAGDSVLISGTIYTARDAAHERMTRLFKHGEPFPFDIKGQVIYYAGPCPAKPGEVIGSCGPTTAGRMDAYTPLLLDNGLGAMIGKGARSEAVVDAMRRNGVVYFGAIGGAGALIAETIKSAEVIAYDDLGTEAIRKLTVEDFPAVVLIDCEGNDLYEQGQKAYREI